MKYVASHYTDNISSPSITSNVHIDNKAQPLGFLKTVYDSICWVADDMQTIPVWATSITFTGFLQVNTSSNLTK